jgi:beta-glucosidase
VEEVRDDHRQRQPAPLVLAGDAEQLFLRAVAQFRLLFGDHNPGGRLTQTWYADDAELPSILDYDISKTGMTYQYFRGKPLCPFGYGLSYTSFQYGDAKPITKADGRIESSVKVTNTGNRAGSDVVELYSSAGDSRAQQPIKQLRAFQ